MAPKRAHFAPRVRRVDSNYALRTRPEYAMKQIRELKCANKKLKTALNVVSDRADAALEADAADGEGTLQQVQAIRDQVQSDED